MKTVLTNCTVIDCTGHPAWPDTTVIIDPPTITELRPGIYRQNSHDADVRVFDLEGGYILPGLWDVHNHLGDLIPDPQNLLETEALPDYTLRACRNAMDAIKAGIMGVRTVGEDGYVDVALKRAFAKGVFVGPRLFVCGRAISATGGHGHGTLGAVEIDGPYEMRKMVRQQLKHGVDQIKLMVTGGVMTAGEAMQESQLLPDEIKAATELAHMKGKRVCVHAWGTEGIKAAIRGGVDSIEHGLLDDEAIEMMLKHNIFYVPTICQTQDEKDILEGGLPQFMIDKALGAAQAHREGFQKAVKAGVTIACGSDGTPLEEFTLKEIEYMVKAGMTEMQALIAATRNAADVCGVADQFGTVEVGKVADLIVVSANPLENITNLRDLKLVLKGGQVVDTGRQEGEVAFREIFY